MPMTPMIAVHLTAALAALGVGPVALWARRGHTGRIAATQRPRLHRAAGYAWVTLMLLTALSALFIHDPVLPGWFGFSPIHLFVPLTLGGLAQAIVVDVHCEATSEKMAMGSFCDGRASLVVGTHTHVPTADHMILPGGTGYLTDAGMCGDYNSVIGMEKLEPLRRFITGMASGRFEPANGPATLSGVYVETDDRTGRATRIKMIRNGGVLEQSAP